MSWWIHRLCADALSAWIFLSVKKQHLKVSSDTTVCQDRMQKWINWHSASHYGWSEEPIWVVELPLKPQINNQEVWEITRLADFARKLFHLNFFDSSVEWVCKWQVCNMILIRPRVLKYLIIELIYDSCLCFWTRSHPKSACSQWFLDLHMTFKVLSKLL